MNIGFTGAVVTVAIFTLVASHAQVAKPAKNLLANGDFSAGIVHWKGDGKAEVFKAAAGPGAAKPPAGTATPAPTSLILGSTLGKSGADADRSYCVTLGSRSQTFSQSFSVPRNAKNLRIAFRMRTGEGFMTERPPQGALQFRLRYPNGNISMFDQMVERTEALQIVSVNYALSEPTRNLDFVVEVFPGAGQLYFDDFVIVALDS